MPEHLLALEERFALGYAHPSMVVLVEDSQTFLKDIELSVPRGIVYRSFAGLGLQATATARIQDRLGVGRDVSCENRCCDGWQTVAHGAKIAFVLRGPRVIGGFLLVLRFRTVDTIDH